MTLDVHSLTCTARRGYPELLVTREIVQECGFKVEDGHQICFEERLIGRKQRLAQSVTRRGCDGLELRLQEENAFVLASGQH